MTPSNEERSTRNSEPRTLARGGVLVAVALVVGFVILAQGFGDRSPEVSEASNGSTSATTSTQGSEPDDTTTEAAGASSGPPTQSADTSAGPQGAPETTVVEQLHPPSEVRVLAANGDGGAGIAGAIGDKLSAQGYVVELANASPTEASQILYRPGYGLDATQIAETLGVDASVVVQIAQDAETPVEPDSAGEALDSNVVVIAGTDGVIR